MPKPEAPWTMEYWQELETQLRASVIASKAPTEAWDLVVKQARAVLRSYSTSFFIVTRFLPPAKRAQVEAIYAAVRYPDEVVDTFKIPAQQKRQLLDDWQTQYDVALSIPSIQERIKIGIPSFVASFAQVVLDANIPHEYYRSFLAAMRHDVNPGRFETLDDLIDNYIYGSAIVVGYFLAYVYGPATGNIHGADFQRAITSSRDLGIALQLTNFLRDVAEDQKRNRIYLPLDMLRAEGVTQPDANDPSQQVAFQRVLKTLTNISEDYYQQAFANLDAFAPDCRTAILACIDVYRQLNRQIETSPHGIQHRESVPMRRKFQVLPPSKYWRLPLAYLSR